jgi:hypothetical protein
VQWKNTINPLRYKVMKNKVQLPYKLFPWRNMELKGCGVTVLLLLLVTVFLWVLVHNTTLGGNAKRCLWVGEKVNKTGSCLSLLRVIHLVLWPRFETCAVWIRKRCTTQMFVKVTLEGETLRKGNIETFFHVLQCEVGWWSRMLDYVVYKLYCKSVK